MNTYQAATACLIISLGALVGIYQYRLADGVTPKPVAGDPYLLISREVGSLNSPLRVKWDHSQYLFIAPSLSAKHHDGQGLLRKYIRLLNDHSKLLVSVEVVGQEKLHFYARAYSFVPLSTSGGPTRLGICGLYDAKGAWVPISRIQRLYNPDVFLIFEPKFQEQNLELSLYSIRRGPVSNNEGLGRTTPNYSVVGDLNGILERMIE